MQQDIGHKNERKFIVLTFKQLQEEQVPWVQHNFPNRQDYYPLLGIQEEIGELSHAHLKNLQCIRGDPFKHFEDKRDAIGDIVIYLADYCTANNIDFQAAVEDAWNKVKQRDWKKDNMKGGE